MEKPEEQNEFTAKDIIKMTLEEMQEKFGKNLKEGPKEESKLEWYTRAWDR